MQLKMQFLSPPSGHHRARACMLLSLKHSFSHRSLPLLLTKPKPHHRAFVMASILAATGRENVPAEPAAKVQRTEGPAVEALRVRRLNEHALLPTRGSAGAAGYDLASCEDTVVPARGRAVVKTGLQIACPPGTYARVAPRSGLAVKHFIDTGAGVVDEDYRGEVGVVLFNHADAPFVVKRGDRVAQLILERIATPEVEEVDSLDDTQRGAGGYGSTGVAS